MSLERRQAKKLSTASGGAGRIGDLPDDLLHHVLSFLPAHEAVSTCRLGRRWRHLWKSAPALRVTGVKGCYNPPWFVNFVDNLLLLRDPRARLDSIELDLHERDFDFKAFLPAYEARLSLWFRHALMCGPRVLLALRTTNGIYEDPDDYDTLKFPNVPLISHHLTRLELKMVRLYSSTLDFSGCPALVHLRMDECDIEGNISSPYLKHLSFVDGWFQTDPFRARISLPGLVSLELTGLLRRAPVLESMPLLVSAVVRLDLDCHDSCTDNDYGDCGNSRCWSCHDPQTGADDRRGESVLLKGLSEVTELELSADSQVFIVNRDLKLCPTFGKLKTLLLSKWCPDIASDLNVLSCFLKHSPILEKLTLQLSEVPKDPAITQRSYTLSGQSFACRHLKIVEIKCDEVDGRAHKVLDILSSHGVPREKVHIQRTNKPINLVDLNFIVNRDLKLCPTFGKLKTLLLSKWCPDIASDLNVLSCFLKHSPILEKLTLQLSEVPKEPAITQRSYTLSGQSFACSHLKIVEIKCDEVDGRAHKVLDILSSHGVPHEKVHIQRTNKSSGS